MSLRTKLDTLRKNCQWNTEGARKKVFRRVYERVIMQKNLIQATEGQKKPTVVKNRDILVLADVQRLKQEIHYIEQRRKWQRERMFSIQSQPLSGMPGGGTPKGLDEAYAALAELEEELVSLLKTYKRRVKRSDQIIEGIESGTMRTFVRMKYVYNVSDTEIRRRLSISRRGFERAKMAVESAPCMAAVKWQERYILAADDG